MALNPKYSVPRTTFQFYVGFVDHASTVNDEQSEGVLENLSPETGRSLHVGGWRLGYQGASSVVLNILVPVQIVGDFKMPQRGDVIWVEEISRGDSTSSVYLFSTYNNSPPHTKYSKNLLPMWGSFEGDYGHLKTHRDHSRQFSAQVTEANFITKYVRSITGHRLRNFHNSTLEEGRFVLRGDPVFDIDSNISKEIVVEDGVHIGYGGALEKDQGKYPDPLNVPAAREENENFKYSEVIFEPLDEQVPHDIYANDGDASIAEREVKKFTLKNKNYMAYEPILDKTYFDNVEFEREIPAALEYVVALRGNNKLVIQDQNGDGEQLLIALKNQYDAGFTVLHNGENGQVRVRDHLGQGVLLEAHEEKPRVMAWTAHRQVVEMGATNGKGTFTYIRNGDKFGDATSEFGTETGLEKSGVSNQEFLMVSSPDIVGDLSSRLSDGFESWVAGGAGFYMRNSTENPSDNEQKVAMYDDGGTLVTKFESKLENDNIHAWESSVAEDSVSESSRIVHGDTGNIVNRSASVDDSSTSESVEHTHQSALGSIAFSRNTGPNSAQETTVLSNDSGDEITTNRQTGVGYTTNVVLAGLPVNDVEADISSLTLRRYLNGAPESEVVMMGGLLELNRMLPGVALNIGVDGTDGPITIGNDTAPLSLAGLTIDAVSEGLLSMSGANITASASGAASAGNITLTASADFNATANIMTLTASAIDMTNS